MAHVFWITFLSSVSVMLLIQWIGRRGITRNKKFASGHAARWRELRSHD